MENLLKRKNKLQLGDNMEFTNDEKEVLRHLLKKHIEEVDKANDTPNLQAGVFMAEEEYEEFLRNLLEKIE